MPYSALRRVPPEQKPEPVAEPEVAASGVSWPAAIVVITFITVAAVLFGLGHPAGAVLGLLGGAAAVALELLRRIGGRS